MSVSDKVRTLLKDLDVSDGEKQRIAERALGLIGSGLPTNQAIEHAKRDEVQRLHRGSRSHGMKGIRDGQEVPQSEKRPVHRPDRSP